MRCSYADSLEKPARSSDALGTREQSEQRRVVHLFPVIWNRSDPPTFATPVKR
jgi:hypothetical protein